MAKDLLSLAAEFEQLPSKIDKAASKIAVDVAMVITGDLAYKTPVDTSNALSNWQVSLTMPTSFEIPPHYPGIKGSTFRASAAETLSKAKIVLTAKKPGEAIFIANNVDYIVDLNNGSSRQQPAGFVQRAELLGRKLAGNSWLKLK